jgi:1-aminocyclopropane-1-carboxylate deaminase/D-cysteine desulfhydrase-like pyridoxal-dependent ACC family enzyme
LHGDHKELVEPRGNLLLMLMAGASAQIVSPSEIGPAMRSAMDGLRSEGLRPCEIPGGGHSLAGCLAYVEAADELREHCRADGWQPEWLIHASGTGATQAGLVAGLDRIHWPTRVIGISVARRNPRGTDVVERAYREVRSHLAVSCDASPIDFRDDWVGQGYEQADASVIDAIRRAASREGLILDPTYTGKAFAGLLDLVASGEVPAGAQVLFWHTGGLLNLMASDHTLW